MYAEKYRDSEGQYRFRIKADNHEILSQGEGYDNRTDRDATLARLHPGIEVREVEA